jgi:hypothetical protein
MWIHLLPLALIDGAGGGVNPDNPVRGATNYWGRIREKSHIHPDSPDYSKAIAEAIRQELQAKAEKKRLEKELKAVERIPVKKLERKTVKPWVDPTKNIREQIAVQDSLIAQARSHELALRLQAIQAERIAKQNQEQEDAFLILMALDD